MGLAVSTAMLGADSLIPRVAFGRRAESFNPLRPGKLKGLTLLARDDDLVGAYQAGLAANKFVAEIRVDLFGV